MAYFNTKLKDISDSCSAFLREKGISEPIMKFEKTSDPQFGDTTTNAAMRYAKELGVKPMDLAENISECISSQNHPFVKSVQAVKPGFVNVTLNAKFHNEVLQDVLRLKDGFGKGETHKGQHWVIEHTSPNPNKAMHIGHLRINLVGMSLANIIEWEGGHVIRDAVYNDRGIAIAKVMYGFLAIMKKEESAPTTAVYWGEHAEQWKTPEEMGIRPDDFITRCYVAGEKASKEDPAIDQVIRDMAIQWEKDDAPTWKLWEHVLTYSYEGINRTLSRLQSRWDNVWYEHEYYKEGKSYVEEGLKKGIFKKLPDGAVLTDLAAYNLPDTIVLKNDGTSLYITQDIALTARKQKKYAPVDYMVWVVGPEQSVAMKQVFAICEQLGIGKMKEFIHVTYGYVGLADGESGFKKMSSRTGDVIFIDDVIDEVKKKIGDKMTMKDLDKEEVDRRTEVLAVGAVKFAMLKSGKDQTVAFSLEQSTDTKGDTGVYVLYTYARIMGLLRKAEAAGVVAKVPNNDMTSKDGQVPVAPTFSWFYDATESAGFDYSAHHVSQYLLELCGQFNNWYGQEMILEGDADYQAYKVAIAQATATIIKNGLSILGIDTLEEI